MRASACALFLLAGCSPPECEPSAEQVHGEFSLAAHPSTDRYWIDVPCTVLAVSPFSISLFCAQLVGEVGTATIAFSINPSPPLVQAPLAVQDAVALTYAERTATFTGGKFLHIARDGDLRMLAQRALTVDAKQVLAFADFAPFSVSQSEQTCGREGKRIGHGVEFTSASGTVTVFDQQSRDTAEWSFRVPYAATFEEDCADCGLATYEFLVAAH